MTRPFHQLSALGPLLTATFLIVSAEAAQVVAEFTPVAVNPYGVALAGTTLWQVDHNSTVIRHYDGRDGTLLGSISIQPFQFFRFALTWDGTSLWVVAASAELLRLDPATGRILERVRLRDPSGILTGDPVGLVWTGDGFWILMANSSYVARVDRSSGMMSSRIELGNVGYNGLTWDGSALWLSNVETDLITRMDPATGAVLRSFRAPGAYPTGLAWDGHFMWIADPFGRGGPYPRQRNFRVDLEAEPYEPMVDQGQHLIPSTAVGDIEWSQGTLWAADMDRDSVYRISLVDGDFVQRFGVPYFGVTGIADDGQDLWVADGQSGRIFRHERTTGTALESWPYPGQVPLGMALDGEFLWTADFLDATLRAFSRTDLSLARTLPAPSPGTSGITWDGSRLWVSDWIDDLVHALDPLTGEIEESYALDAGTPTSIAFDHDVGTFWVRDNELQRIVQYARPAGGTHLLRLSADTVAGGVRVHWRRTRSSTASTFEVERQELEETGFRSIGNTVDEGDSAEFLDFLVQPGHAYRYRLRIEESPGTTRTFGPVTALYAYDVTTGLRGHPWRSPCRRTPTRGWSRSASAARRPERSWAGSSICRADSCTSSPAAVWRPPRRPFCGTDERRAANSRPAGSTSCISRSRACEAPHDSPGFAERSASNRQIAA